MLRRHVTDYRSTLLQSVVYAKAISTCLRLSQTCIVSCHQTVAHQLLVQSVHRSLELKVTWYRSSDRSVVDVMRDVLCSSGLLSSSAVTYKFICLQCKLYSQQAATSKKYLSRSTTTSHSSQLVSVSTTVGPAQPDVVTCVIAQASTTVSSLTSKRERAT